LWTASQAELRKPNHQQQNNDTCARWQITSSPQAANEKVWGKRSVELEWKSGTPFMITTIYTLSAGIRASKGASKKLQMIRYGWCGDREAEGRDDRGKGELTTAFGMERKRHSMWDGKPRGLALQGEEGLSGHL
jgi:hypothetical protein